NVMGPGSFEPDRIFEAIRTHQHVSFFAAPTLVSRLINHPLAGSADQHNLETITYGGAPMYLSDLKRALELFGPKLYQVYGQGESPMTISGLTKPMHMNGNHLADDDILLSAGMARTGCAIRVVDDEGRDQPHGEIGEIITTSDCIMTGYWQNCEANAKSLRDGWLWTGDMGSIDARGLLSL
ncbi:MAG: AMP-binding protein, partial [Hyphomicrobiaceae bacterium]